MKKLIIVKIGGNVIDDEIALKKFLILFSKIKGDKILIHGGGKLATRLSEKLGIETELIEGRRITNKETLKVTTMVYAGWINKSISALLNSNNCKAIGLSGADAFIIPAKKRKLGKIDYGFVGDVIKEKINIKLVKALLDSKLTLVIAPITSDKNGQLLNTNADTIAASLASALSNLYKVKLIYCFEKNGVLNGGKVIKQLGFGSYNELKEKGIIKDGMIPKLDNAFSTIENGVKEVVIGNANQLNNIISKNAGTSIIK